MKGEVHHLLKAQVRLCVNSGFHMSPSGACRCLCVAAHRVWLAACVQHLTEISKQVFRSYMDMKRWSAGGPNFLALHYKGQFLFQKEGAGWCYC